MEMGFIYIFSYIMSLNTIWYKVMYQNCPAQDAAVIYVLFKIIQNDEQIVPFVFSLILWS